MFGLTKLCVATPPSTRRPSACLRGRRHVELLKTTHSGRMWAAQEKRSEADGNGQERRKKAGEEEEAGWKEE